MAARVYLDRRSLLPAVSHSFLATAPSVNMNTNSQQPKRPKDGVITSLNLAIEAMNIAKGATNVTPATAVFGVVGTLLTMIRVCLISCGNELLIHVDSGLYGHPNRIRRARASMRRGMQSSSPGIGWEETDGPRSACARCNCTVGEVGQLSYAQFG